MEQPISICIYIVSDSYVLEQKIRSVSTPDNISLEIKTKQNNEITYADILIYDATTTVNELPKADIAFEYILYATDEEQATELLKNSIWTTCWPQTLPDITLGLYLRQMLRSVQAQKVLLQTKTFLNTLIDSVPDLIWFKDLRGSHMKVNDAFCRAVGKTKEQCEGRGHYYIWDLEPDEYAKGEYVCLETEEEVIRRNETCLFDEKVKSKNGLRQFKTYKSPLTDAQGNMFGTVGIAKDVTDLQNVVRELEVILSSLPFAAMIVDEDDVIISVNQKFCEYFSVSSKQILHMHYSDVCNDILNTTPHELEGLNMTEIRSHVGGSLHMYHAQQRSVHDIFGNHFGIFFLCLDVTKEFELQRRLLHSANTDFLTGLCNRRYFYEAIGQKKDMEKISFIYFDLDNFKKVNDTYGHQSGDNALILMADLLQSEFQDQLIARLGGDEFAVAFFGVCDPNALTKQVEKFIDQTDITFLATEHMEALTVSAGIACNGNSRDVDTILSYADKALYKAKAMGKARYTVYTEPF